MKNACAAKAVSLLGFVVIGCGQAPQEESSIAAPSWRVVDASQLTPAQSAQLDRAVAARDALFDRLKGRLIEVIADEGPAKAIVVCRREAPESAKELSQKEGLKIGRTSHRLCNPKNQPPEWAKPLVAELVDEPRHLVRGEDFAALFPIHLTSECLLCHGAVESIPPDIKQTLAKAYPEDQATGFEAGQLRGWFWVEVPGPASDSP